MADQTPAVAHRYDAEVRRTEIQSKSYWGLTLGDLRSLVESAEGMSDEAEVQLEKVTAHYLRKDVWLAKLARIEEEVRDES